MADAEEIALYAAQCITQNLKTNMTYADAIERMRTQVVHRYNHPRFRIAVGSDTVRVVDQTVVLCDWQGQNQGSWPPNEARQLADALREVADRVELEATRTDV